MSKLNSCHFLSRILLFCLFIHSFLHTTGNGCFSWSEWNRGCGESVGGREGPASQRPAALHVWDPATRPVLPATQHQGFKLVLSKSCASFFCNLLKKWLYDLRTNWPHQNKVGIKVSLQWWKNQIKYAKHSPPLSSYTHSCSRPWKRKVLLRLSWGLFPKPWGTPRIAVSGWKARSKARLR